MTKFKKIILVGSIVLVLGTTGLTAYAASSNSNSRGTMANESCVLSDVRGESVEVKKEKLAGLVASEEITQEEADAIIARIETNQATCDGTGSGNKGQQSKSQNGKRQGNGTCNGTGICDGTGLGNTAE